jgi:hypothetical protein
MYESIHGCVDFLLLSRVIFVSFLGYFVGFWCAIVPLILRSLCLDFFLGSWIDALCIFMLDLDPSNSEFGL